MLSKVFSATIVGLDAQTIEVEVDASYGLRHFSIVGLPDKAVEESKERVGAAIKSSKFKSPHQEPIRILVNLAPADLKKEGSFYDLPIALGCLTASKQIKLPLENKIFLGELGLDGKLRPIKGALSFAMAAQRDGWSEIILPKANAREASLIAEHSKSKNNPKFKVTGVNSLKETIDYLQNKKQIPTIKTNLQDILENPSHSLDFDLIKGQSRAKRALVIATAGGHNILMYGPPGTGKTLLAKAIASISPSLNFKEALEITKIYSINGILPKENPLINVRPFRNPHHSTSEVALIGGGNPPKAGEITLSHRGVLFLDEFPEFHRDVLESLRQPMEEGEITILRAKHSLTLPARFILVAAANPCPCGFFNDPNRECTCAPSQIAKYQRKLSGPLMDRIDLFINVPAIKYEKLIEPETNESDIARTEIKKARKIQEQRTKGSINAEMSLQQIKQHCEIDSKSQNILKTFIDKGKMSVRGYHKILKVARTIADLNNSEHISYNHISEAMTYRMKMSNNAL